MSMRTLFLSIAAAVLATGAGLTVAKAPANSNNRYPANFQSVEIATLAEAVAAATGKTILLHPKVHGLVTLVSKQPLSASQLYATFGHVVAVKGYVVEDSRGIVKVYPGTSAD